MPSLDFAEGNFAAVQVSPATMLSFSFSKVTFVGNSSPRGMIPLHADMCNFRILMLKCRQYPSIHNNHIISHCTNLQYNHNI